MSIDWSRDYEAHPLTPEEICRHLRAEWRVMLSHRYEREHKLATCTYLGEWQSLTPSLVRHIERWCEAIDKVIPPETER